MPDLHTENQKKNNIFNIVVPSVYDLIIDKKEAAPKVTNAPVMSKPLNNIITPSQSNSSVEQVTIEDMLRGVQDPNGKNYFQSAKKFDVNSNIENNFGDSVENITEGIKADILNILQENDISEDEFSIDDIKMYGSYTTGQNNKFSDVDFLVEYSGTMREDDAFKFISSTYYQLISIIQVNNSYKMIQFSKK